MKRFVNFDDKFCLFIGYIKLCLLKISTMKTKLRKEFRIEISWEIETSHCELDIHPLSLSLVYIRLLHIHMHRCTDARISWRFFLSSRPIVVRSFEPRVKHVEHRVSSDERNKPLLLVERGSNLRGHAPKKHLRVYVFFFFFSPTIEKKTSIFSETDRIDASTIIFKAGIYINAISKELFRCR